MLLSLMALLLLLAAVLWSLRGPIALPCSALARRAGQTAKQEPCQHPQEAARLCALKQMLS